MTEDVCANFENILSEFAREHLDEHRAPATGEINLTALGEQIADEFGLYADTDEYEPAAICFEVAFQAAGVWPS